MPLTEEMQSLVQEIFQAREDRKQEIAQLRQAAIEQRRATAQELADRGRALRSQLAKTRPELAEARQRLHQATAQLRSQLAKVSQRRHQTTVQEMGRLKAELSGARRAWQKVATTQRTRREASGVTEERAVEITPELAALKEQVFAYLANHPDGTKTSELEREFTLTRPQMTLILKSLLDENKVVKRGLSYFAI